MLQLLKQIVEDEALVQRFKRAPAAIKMHHAYLGGLIEHTLNLLEVGVAVLPRYPLLDPIRMHAGFSQTLERVKAQRHAVMTHLGTTAQ